MNTLTVGDVLQLPALKNHRIVAGEKGLSNPVNYPNVYDNLHDDTDIEKFKPSNDFVLTSFYFGKDDSDYIRKVIRFFIQLRVAAVCIEDEYIDDLPEDSKALCNQHNLPVIFINALTPYSSIIASIIEFKMLLEERKLLSNQLSAITDPRISQAEKNDIIHDLNPDFRGNAVVFFAVDPSVTFENRTTTGRYLNLLNNFHIDSSSLVTEYREGLLFVYTFKELNAIQLEDYKGDIIEQIQKLFPEFTIGVSNPTPIQQLGQAILQAFMAAHSGTFTINNVIPYSILGITRLLLAMEDHPGLNTFYHETIDPILAYDKKNNASLFETIEFFMQNEMDYKKTAKAMYVHENTIRYRMSRIRELINFGKTEIDFFETISIVYKIHKLKGG